MSARSAALPEASAPRRTRSLQVALLLAAAPLVTLRCGPPKPPPHAVAVASGDRRDFGPLWIGEKRQETFTIENRGGRELLLDPVHSSCGCLVARLGKKQLAPGESTEMVAELHADKGPARLDKVISIGTNDPARPWLQFLLSADAKALYEFTPPLIDLPQLVLGEPQSLELPVRVVDGQAVQFGTPQVPAPGFAAQITADSPTTARVTVTFDGTGSSVRRLFHIAIPTDHPRVPQLSIPVQALVHGRLRAEPPDRLDFGVVPRTSGATRTVLLHHRGRTPLTLEPTVEVQAWPGRKQPGGGVAPADQPAAVTASISTIEPGRTWKLEATVAPGTTGGGLFGRLLVRLDLPDEPALTLSLAGRIEE